MLIKQFNQPVHCAICNKFIWYTKSLAFFSNNSF
jgi:hypothetical protein